MFFKKRNNSTDKLGRSDLHYAASENNSEKLKKLLQKGADVNAQDKNGFTRLHFAAQEFSVDAVITLLDNKAEVDKVNIYGNSPLLTAVYNSNGRGEIIKLLLKNGADPTLENKNGSSPLSLAKLIGNYDVIQFFEP